ncbi:TPA: hypothetical protein HA238_05305 [Candidatus Micrarchaeota archaeon]|nr:hypothetical protein [Candidatus Micrarchaeota archaeon]
MSGDNMRAGMHITSWSVTLRGQLSIELLASFLVLLAFISILVSGLLLYSKNSEEFGKRLFATAEVESTARMLDAISSSGGTVAVSAVLDKNPGSESVLLVSVSNGTVSMDLGAGGKVVISKTFFGNKPGVVENTEGLIYGEPI